MIQSGLAHRRREGDTEILWLNSEAVAATVKTFFE